MKRVVRLLANRAWSAELVEEWLLEQADQLVAQQEDVALVALDQSVQEKAESLAAQGALSGRSSKARRLERPRLALVTLAYAFLVWLLTQPGERVAALLRLGCHRTGQWTRHTPSPLYRLHAAIAALWARVFPAPLAAFPP